MLDVRLVVVEILLMIIKSMKWNSWEKHLKIVEVFFLENIFYLSVKLAQNDKRLMKFCPTSLSADG